jgi:hypothetical protein
MVLATIKIKKIRDMRDVKDWSDITVGQYQEMMLVQTDNEITKFIECISIALDCDPAEIREMPFSEYNNLQKKMEFISREPTADIVERFELDGIRYGLEPDMSLITTGVFIDAEQFKQDPVENLHNTLALIYRPIISETETEWTIEPHQAKGFEKRAKLFKEKMSIETVLGATVFFSLLGVELSTLFLTSLNKTMAEEN